MKRFISHEELARDSRFKRAGARGRLLESLPDDVDGVVALMEQVAPRLRERVEGTELEKVYDDLGPGYPFLTQFGSLHPEDPNVEVQLKVRLHGIFVGELQALEGAGRTLWDFPDAPWEFRMNMARQCWDESRHCQVFEKLLDHVGVEVGDYPETTTLFEAACADDPTLRVAGVNRCLEGLACDAFRAMIDYAKEADDSIMEQAIDFVLADELTHVRFGSNWVKQFTRSNPDKFREAKEFQRDVERRFSIGSGRSGRDDAVIGIAREERLEAGFTEEELRELAEIADQGPSRDTLVEAAKVLRARHLARSARRAGRADAPDAGGGRRGLTRGARGARPRCRPGGIEPCPGRCSARGHLGGGRTTRSPSTRNSAPRPATRVRRPPALTTSRSTTGRSSPAPTCCSICGAHAISTTRTISSARCGARWTSRGRRCSTSTCTASATAEA